MRKIPISAVSEYQCPGCINGTNPRSCTSKNITDIGCTSHVPATFGVGSGSFMLGLPNGFNRFGPTPTRALEVYASYDEMVKLHPNLKTKFSTPVWKHLDKNGNTLIRYFSPRTNYGWTAVVLENCLDQLPTALEISAEDISEMD